MFYAVAPFPVGQLAVMEEAGSIVGISYFKPGGKRKGVPKKTPLIDDAFSQLSAYFEGRLKAFDLPLQLSGTPFQHKVWAALKTIPYGQTCSYGQIAARIGSPKASRAVGMANHRNPIVIVVPCHRVIGSDGALTGYGGGLAVKEALLALEKRYA